MQSLHVSSGSRLSVLFITVVRALGTPRDVPELAWLMTFFSLPLLGSGIGTRLTLAFCLAHGTSAPLAPLLVPALV